MQQDCEEFGHIAFSQQTESGQEVGLGRETSRPKLSDLLPPARLPLLKVPKATKTAPSAGEQAFKYMSL